MITVIILIYYIVFICVYRFGDRYKLSKHIGPLCFGKFVKFIHINYNIYNRS